jgi:hypothetical protein
MPVSDWDVLAVDELGRPSNGVSEASPAGVRVEVAENALHVYGEDLWSPLGSLPRPLGMVVRGGDLLLRDTHVLAEPVARGGLAWATWFFRGADPVATVGVVTMGFDEGGRYAGVTPAAVDALRDALARWQAGRRLPAGLAALPAGHALRFNQGDAFFAARLGHALPATPVGEAEVPFAYAPRPAHDAGQPAA